MLSMVSRMPGREVDAAPADLVELLTATSRRVSRAAAAALAEDARLRLTHLALDHGQPNAKYIRLDDLFVAGG